MDSPPSPARSSMQRKACCNNESFHALSSHEWLASHSSLGSSQSVRLQCGKGKADRRGPRSVEHAMQGTCCNNESGHALNSHEWLASHSSLGSSQSVRLICGTGNVDRRGAATQGMDVANCIGPFHAPASHKWLVHHSSFLQIFFPVAAEAFTELECEG